jgi:diguanylate cyclase (GGDEF)-like protein
MRRSINSHPVLACVTFALALGVGFEFLRAFTDVGGRSLYWRSPSGLYTAVGWIAVAVCAARAVRRREDRLAWTLIAFGLATWSAGDLVWTVWLNSVANPPFPSVADLAHLLTYPAFCVALMLLMRSRMHRAGTARWLDGAVVGLTVAAIAATLAFSSVLALTHGRFIAEVVKLAYPLGDFALLACVACAFSLADWRPGWMWLMVGAGVATIAIADIIYVVQVAQGNYFSGALLSALNLLSISLLALAAWVRAPKAMTRRDEAPQTIILTAIAATCALVLLLVAAFTPITPLAVGLARVALLTASARVALAYVENLRMLRSSAQEATTDSLSGLCNRRRLMSDLDDACARAQRGVAATLIFFDLNGFKRYNDTFGHAAGDALLARIGASLRTELGDLGTAYRLGGDEFCVLIEEPLRIEDPLIARLAGALIERGHGFTVDVSMGLASIPDDARTPSALLQLADERMYADKRRASLAQTRDVLLALLDERAPRMREEAATVITLARAVASELEIGADELDTVLRAAELRDIGKLAIPDKILNKSGPLDPNEWEFMRQHPAIGERILCAAPPLVPVARIVRAVHERWDGSGYPDGRAGESIPRGARIIAACDAYNAITADRANEPARSRQAAMDELRDRAGGQLDPEVVHALCRAVESAEDLGLGRLSETRLSGGTQPSLERIA